MIQIKLLQNLPTIKAGKILTISNVKDILFPIYLLANTPDIGVIEILKRELSDWFEVIEEKKSITEVTGIRDKTIYFDEDGTYIQAKRDGIIEEIVFPDFIKEINTILKEYHELKKDNELVEVNNKIKI